ncbi:P-loop containing nucleoside triphosphate hydrolase protein [Jackrogersella minutella]|nr:P-loop containing nucleoside triphosphate hydrolase protein [Jackrogersella minutella]
MIPIISLLGIPACGKGTIGAMLAKQFDLYYISFGDMLRSLGNIKSFSVITVRQYIYEYTLNGGIIPADLCAELEASMDWTVAAVIYNCHARRELVPLAIALPSLQRRLQRASKEYKYRGILLDGFPRQLDHLKAAQRVVGSSLPNLTIVIECPEEVARSRYLKRAGDNDSVRGFEKRLAHFKENMKLLRPELERNGLVRTVNDGSMTVGEAYVTLLTQLFHNKTWNDIANSSI